MLQTLKFGFQDSDLDLKFHDALQQLTNQIVTSSDESDDYDVAPLVSPYMVRCAHVGSFAVFSCLPYLFLSI